MNFFLSSIPCTQALLQTHLLSLLSNLAELLLGLGQLLLTGLLRAIVHILQKGIEDLSIELVPAPSLLRAAWGTVVLGLQLGVRLLQGLEGGARLTSQLQHTGRPVMARHAESKLQAQALLPFG